MISKALFKHSYKSNFGLWSFVSCITCGMLAVVILVLGNLNVSSVRNSMIDTFTKDAIEKTIEKEAVTYFNILDESLSVYEQELEYNKDLKNFGNKYKEIRRELYAKSFEEANDYARSQLTKDLDEEKTAFVNSFLDYCLTREDGSIDRINYNFDTNKKYESFILNLVIQSISNQLSSQDIEVSDSLEEVILEGIEQYKAQSLYSSNEFGIYYISNVMKKTLSEEEIDYQNKMIKVKEYFDSEEIYEKALYAIKEFNIATQIEREKLISESAANIESLIKEYRKTYIDNLPGGLLEDLPNNVSTALNELGNLDIYALVISEVFYRMAGMLLPIVFIILCSNNLVANQVDTGSMAYILSTPTKRRKVMFTQAAYLIFSLFIMCVLTTITGLLCLNITKSQEITISNSQLLLFNIGFFVTLFAIAGICFLSSCWFNRSKIAMSVGGGISIFFLMITILGLFGLKVMPSMIRIDAMDFFNHISLISLFDTMSILEHSNAFIWKWLILIAIGIITFAIGFKKFVKKDLPL